MKNIKPMTRYEAQEFTVSNVSARQTLHLWLSGLTGRGVAESLVAAAPNPPNNAADRLEDARALSTYIAQGLRFLDEADMAPPETAFVSVYYGMLNLAKAVLVAAGRRSDLGAIHHGAHWSGSATESHGLLTDKITIHPDGVMPLFFTTLTGAPWPKSANRSKPAGQNKKPSLDRDIVMRDVYPLILDISHECAEVLALPSPFHVVKAHADPTTHGAERLSVAIEPGLGVHNQSSLGVLKGLTPQQGSLDHFVGPEVAPTPGAPPGTGAARTLRRHLLYSCQMKARIETPYGPQAVTEFSSTAPRSRSNIKMPEEFPLLLAAFHLSNVARYDPGRMSRMLDDRSRVVILALHRLAGQRFMHLTWEFLNQKQYWIVT